MEHYCDVLNALVKVVFLNPLSAARCIPLITLRPNLQSAHVPLSFRARLSPFSSVSPPGCLLRRGQSSRQGKIDIVFLSCIQMHSSLPNQAKFLAEDAPYYVAQLSKARVLSRQKNALLRLHIATPGFLTCPCFLSADLQSKCWPFHHRNNCRSATQSTPIPLSYS
jgi:hypothetical protein